MAECYTNAGQRLSTASRKWVTHWQAAVGRADLGVPIAVHEVAGMAGPKSPRVIELTEEERATLVHWTRSPSAAAGLVRRARIVLLAAQQVPVRRIALQAPASRTMVREWLDRFRQQRLPGLQERPRPGRPRAFPP